MTSCCCKDGTHEHHRGLAGGLIVKFIPGSGWVVVKAF
jgi:hypothetical protein